MLAAPNPLFPSFLETDCILWGIIPSNHGTHSTNNGKIFTLPKTNMDTPNDGLEKVTPFKNGNFWYLC